MCAEKQNQVESGTAGITNEKKLLRKSMKSVLSSYFAENDVASVSEKTCSLFCDCEFFKNADYVLSFVTNKFEIGTSTLNEKAFESTRLALPRVASGTELDFFVLDKNCASVSEQLESGSFGIMEPKTSLEKLDVASLSGKKVLVAVPGIAFTKSGKRCGYGRGYYDRFLRKLRECGAVTKFVGLCLPCQIIEEVPTDEYDVVLDDVLF